MVLLQEMLICFFCHLIVIVNTSAAQHCDKHKNLSLYIVFLFFFSSLLPSAGSGSHTQQPDDRGDQGGNASCASSASAGQDETRKVSRGGVSGICGNPSFQKITNPEVLGPYPFAVVASYSEVVSFLD